MEMMERFKVPNVWNDQPVYFNHNIDGQYFLYTLRYGRYKDIIPFDGWCTIFSFDNGKSNTERKYYFLEGRQTSAAKFIECIFDRLTEEEKNELIWNLDEWN